MKFPKEPVMRTPKLKNETPREVEVISAPVQEVSSFKVAADEKNKEYQVSDKRLEDLASEFSIEEIAFFAKSKGLGLKEEIVYKPHTFQVSENNLVKYQAYSKTLGKTKKQIINEALEQYFDKHEVKHDAVDKITQK